MKFAWLSILWCSSLYAGCPCFTESHLYATSQYLKQATCSESIKFETLGDVDTRIKGTTIRVQDRIIARTVILEKANRSGGYVSYGTCVMQNVEKEFKSARDYAACSANILSVCLRLNLPLRKLKIE